MTPHQRQAQFGNECHVVPTTATGSNTVPTRQHPELGQAHRGRMYYRTAQMVTTWPSRTLFHANTLTLKDLK